MATDTRAERRDSALSSENRIDVICDAFEEAWGRGIHPNLSAHLESCEPLIRSRLFSELLLVEVEYLGRRKQDPDWEEYIRRFPEFTEETEKVRFRWGQTNALHDLTTHPEELATGTRVGQFELVQKLGFGAAGEVWRARDTRLQRMVAIKMPIGCDLSEQELHRFLREGRAAAQLRSPHIVAVHEVGRDGSTAYIVSDFVLGEDLRARLDRSRWPYREVAELCAKLAEALHHAHELGIIHRDLKPANVIIDQAGEPHVTDFGLAKWAEDSHCLTLHGQLLGTPAYMSPEQARGDAAVVDRRSDVYSLGVMLYEMLTGRRPFEGDQAGVLHAILHMEPLPPRSVDGEIPRDLETICLKAMDKGPGRRYLTAQEMAVDLRRFLRGDPILARRTTALEKGWRWLRRRPAVAAALVLAVIAASAFAMVGMLVRENHELLGLRTVTLTTKPPGAKVAFVPLSLTTGEPMLSDAIIAAGISPVREELKPGDYFVVVVLPDDRFHEVYRHVPDQSEQIAFAYNHRSWDYVEDGVIKLPKIVVPAKNVTYDMALIDVTNPIETRGHALGGISNKRQGVASFYVDTTEFTFADYEQRIRRSSDGEPESLKTDRRAMTVGYDEAVAYAEDLGKRLPTEREYEFMATGGGQTRYPWGNEFPEASKIQEFGPVGSIEFDRIPTKPPVFGLCSNIAEWTCSAAAPLEPHPQIPIASTFIERRIVRGGDLAVIEGDPSVNPTRRNPQHRTAIVRYESKPGLGFRCVRSANPCMAFKEL